MPSSRISITGLLPFAVAIVLALAIFAIVLGTWRWQSTTSALFARLERDRLNVNRPRYDLGQLDSLPPPVQRYFRAALTDGQPVVTAVRMQHAGTFNMSETGERWAPFTSLHRVITRSPGFVWYARIAMAPGMRVRVHDAYVNGHGLLHASLSGLFTVARAEGTTWIAEAELMRFLAEAPWYPTALLPAEGVRWTPRDDRSATATLVDGAIAVSLIFYFHESGLIESIHASARGRTVGDQIVPTPWEGRWQQYETREGMRIPTEGEVAWLLPEGRQPYWRGRLTSIHFELSP